MKIKRKFLVFIITIVFIITSIAYLINFLRFEKIDFPDQQSTNEVETKGDAHEMVKYFAPTITSEEKKESLMNELKKIESEMESINSWQLIGPSQIFDYENNLRLTGRILDVEITRESSSGRKIRFSAASGGLWEFGTGTFLPKCISENLKDNLCIESFDTKPGDDNTILVGTGEYSICGSSGLFKTTNGGINYSKVDSIDNPSGFFLIRYQGNSLIHIAAHKGYYRSTNDGSQWTKINITNSF